MLCKNTPRKKKRLTLRGRLIMVFSLFSAILIAVLWLFQIVFLEEIYKGIKIAEIRSASKELTAKINDPELSTVAEKIGTRKNVCVLVLLIEDDGDVRTLVSADCIARCVIHHPNIDTKSFYELYRFVDAEGGDKLQYYRYDARMHAFLASSDALFERSEDEQSIVYTSLIEDALGNRLMVMLNSIISPVEATVQTLRRQLIVITGLILLLSALLALFLSKRLARPITELNEKAKRLAGSDYSIDFTATGYQEICELGETLNRAEAELSQVDRLKDELIANISHDLRTPLTLISGYAEVMRDIPGESTPENLQIIIDEAGRLTSFVNQLLDLSKLQSGAVPMNPDYFSLTQYLNEALVRYNKMLNSQEYRILLSAPDEVTVYADRVRFEQAFYNLLNNAITHTGEDKTVTITQQIICSPGTTIPSSVRVSVIDSGEGIAPDKLPYIWDRYYKVDKVHKRAQLGSGLGLSIVKTIMERMGGSYGVESTPGKGSCFWIELPLNTDHL